MFLRRILALMMLTGAILALVSAPESRLSAADTEQEKKEKRKAFLKKRLEEAKKAEEAKRAEEAKQAEGKKAYDSKPAAPPVPPPVVPEKASDAKSLAKRIDAEIQKSLTAAKITPSERSTDAEFVRRVYLDLAGVIPTPEQAKAFLDSKDEKKREKLIDELLESKNYGQRLSDIWTGMMSPVDSDNRFVDKQPLAKWLTDQFNANVGWDKLVKTVLTATGDQDEHGEVTYYMANRGVDKITDSVGKLFLGIQLQCAQCHNHPFTSWKQDEYWGMAQFFYKVNAIVVNPKKDNGKKEDQVSETGRVNRKMNPLPESAKNVPARFLGAGEVKLTPSEPYRPVLAEWVVSPKNPYFAKAMVNRTWALLMGRGFVHPVDDMLPENEPSHPELLNQLTGEFIASGFDLKHLVRAICNSDAYQRTSKPTASNKSDERLYSRQAMKTLSPEQLYDSILLALGAQQDNPRNKGTNPMLRPRITPRDQFVLFFQPGEEARATDYDAGIPQVLRLMNASRYNTSVSLNRELAKAKPEEALEKIYLRILSRLPTEDEVKRLKTFIAQEGEKSYADIIWALVNSSEFALNR